MFACVFALFVIIFFASQVQLPVGLLCMNVVAHVTIATQGGAAASEVNAVEAGLWQDTPCTIALAGSLAVRHALMRM